MLEELKEKVLDANLELVRQGLVIYTWGNVSGIDRDSNLVVIKPSGVDYDGMKASDMVVVDLDGNVVEGSYRPSSDTPTHVELYKHFKDMGAVVHTHSHWAVSFAQAGMPITAFGTTHADYFYNDIICTRALTRMFSETIHSVSTMLRSMSIPKKKPMTSWKSCTHSKFLLRIRICSTTKIA